MPACVLQIDEPNFLEFNEAVVFDRIDNLVVTGAGSPINGGAKTSDATVRGPCPLLEFSHVTEVSVNNLVLECMSPRRHDIFPAVLITDTTKLALSVEAITAMWYVQSAVVVLGGQTNVLPVVRSVDMDGSVVKSTSVVQSAFVAPAALVLGLLYGTVDATHMPAFSRVVVVPVLPPETSTVPITGTRAKLLVNQTTNPLNVKNWTLFSEIMGPDYELEYYHPGEDDEKAIEEMSIHEMTKWVWVYIVIITYAIVVFHQDKFYYYAQSKA